MPPLNKKPPLGVSPKHVHDRSRVFSLRAATERYMSEELPVPMEWIEEYNELVKS